MDLSLQAKLLRVLQEREVEPLGASKPMPLDVRVLATSNRDLEQTVRDGKFREDLYYRLSVFPLRFRRCASRPADIDALARRFVAGRSSTACRGGFPPPRWRGMLRHVVARQRARARERHATRAAALGGGRARSSRGISCSTSARGSRATLDVVGAAALAAAPTTPPIRARRAARRRALGRGDAPHRDRARDRAAARASQAAEQLGISDRTLRYKLQKMRKAGISVPGDRVE